MNIELAPIDSIKPYPNNPRVIPDQAVAAVAESIKQFGFRQPIVTDGARVIVVGHTRWQAAKKLGLAEVPVHVASELTAEQCRAYRLIDNRTNELADWRVDLLSEELAHVKLELPELNLQLTGFTHRDIMPTQAEYGSLADRFIVAPFSVFNAREGWWQNRKRAWIAMGIKSELGRGENLLEFSETMQLKRGYGLTMRTKGYLGEQVGSQSEQSGTSIFDPVVCEILYRWFSPADGRILDPFAGGSVRGIVASFLGRRYTGIDLSEKQIEANRKQWEEIGGKDIVVADDPPAAPADPIPAAAQTPDAAVKNPVGPSIRPVLYARNRIAEEAFDLFRATAGRPMRPAWRSVSPAMQEYLAHVYSGVGDPMAAPAVSPVAPVADAIDDRSMWVAFSGGKDGMAAALRARAEGWRPVLYHVRGINRSLPDEFDYATKAAEAAGMPIIVDRVAISGEANGFVEMPTKNQVITSMMAARMAEYGGANYTLGILGEDTPDKCRANINWSDTTTSNVLWAKHLAELLPGITGHILIHSQMEALAIVASHGLLDFVHGCMSPLRFRGKLRAENVRKYGDAILPGRCGSCFKCWSEYIMLVSLGVVVKNEAFYDHAIAGMNRMAKEGKVNEWVGDPVEQYTDAEALKKYVGTAWPKQPDPPAPIPELKPIRSFDESAKQIAEITSKPLAEIPGIAIKSSTDNEVVIQIVRMKDKPKEEGKVGWIEPAVYKNAVASGNIIEARTDDGTLVGFIWWYAYKRTRVISLNEIVTTRAIKGVGCAMLDRLIRIAQERRVPAIDLEVMATNTDAIAWYEHRGFVRLEPRGDKIDMRLRVPGVADPAAELGITTIAVDPAWVVGDRRNVKALAGERGPFDFVMSCPPYADLENYSDDPADLSNLDYPEFLKSYRAIIAECAGLLKDNRFAAFVVGDIRDKKTGLYRNFVADTIAAFQDAGMRLYNEAILITDIGTLCMRVSKQFSHSRKFGKTHQNILIFVKGDPLLATEACGQIDTSYLDEIDTEA